MAHTCCPMTMPLLVVAVEVGCKVKLGCARGEVNGQLGGEALEGGLGPNARQSTPERPPSHAGPLLRWRLQRPQAMPTLRYAGGFIGCGNMCSLSEPQKPRHQCVMCHCVKIYVTIV